MRLLKWGVGILTVMLIIAVVVFGVMPRTGDEDPADLVSVRKATAGSLDEAAVLNPARRPCNRGGARFVLAYQNHPSNVVIDGGLPHNVDGAEAKFLEVTKGDPDVLRHLLDVFAEAFGTSPVPADKDLTNPANHMEEWCRLRDYFEAVEGSEATLRGGTYQVASMDASGNVTYPEVTVPEGDKAVVFKYGGKEAVFRTHCGNRVIIKVVTQVIIKEKKVPKPPPKVKPPKKPPPTKPPATVPPEPTDTPKPPPPPTATPGCPTCPPPLTPVPTPTDFPPGPTPTDVFTTPPPPPPEPTDTPGPPPPCDCPTPSTVVPTPTDFPDTVPTPTSVFGD